MKQALKLALILSGLSLFTSLACASEPAAISPGDRAWMKEQQQALQEFKDNLQGQVMSLPPAQQSLVNQFGSQIQQSQEGQDSECAFPALYFVSLGIPEEGLLPMLGDANRFGIPATIRGWLENDLRKTATRMFELSKKDKNIGVQIDPTLFQQYGITAVPALVVTCPGHFDVIRGSLPLQDMLKKIAAQGECAATAKQLMGSMK
jgi:conjugal transfer pilus assembly protein TrbC